MIDSYIPSLPLSLYVHFPFCRKRCDYCAFYSSLYDDALAERYYSVLKMELEKVVEDVKKPFHTIYFGGGNPILIGIERIRDLLERAERYGKPEETTIEINPEDVGEDILSLYPLVTRISTGIQTMDDGRLNFLGRRADEKINSNAMKMLSSSPFTWNADIITAIPKSNVSDTLSDIRKVADYNPDHISYYCLTFEENTPLITKAVPVGEEKEREFLLSGWNLLERLGYNHYEVSAFSRLGKECLHNLVYWNLSEYIGLGPTAESFLGFRKGAVLRNTESLDEFLSSPSFNVEPVDERETEETFLMTALRMRAGIDKKEYRERFGISFDERYSERIKNLDDNWYIDTSRSFSLTREGLLVMNQIVLTLSLSI